MRLDGVKELVPGCYNPWKGLCIEVTAKPDDEVHLYHEATKQTYRISWEAPNLEETRAVDPI